MSISAISSVSASNYLIDALNAINVANEVNPVSPLAQDGLSGLDPLFGVTDAQFSTLGQAMSAADTLESSALTLTQGNFSAESASGQLAMVQTFTDAFNRLQGTLQQLSQSEPGLDASLLPLQTSLNNLIQQNQSALAGVGITQNQSGELLLDQTTFQSALNSNAGSVANVFNQDGSGVADTVLTQLEQAALPQSLMQLTNSSFGGSLLIDELLGAQPTQNLSSAALSVLAFSPFGSSLNGQQLNGIFNALSDNTLLGDLSLTA